MTKGETMIKTIDDAIDQFLEDLSYDVLKIWANTLAVEINEPPTGDMWPDWENELKVEVGEALLKALNDPGSLIKRTLTIGEIHKESNEDEEVWFHHKLHGKIMPAEITIPVKNIRHSSRGITLS